MKMTKKIMLGMAAALVAFSFVGCGGLLGGGDGITGGGSLIKINEANDGNTAKRVYKETTLKHAGCLTKVTFKTTDVGTSKMGIMFDIKDNKKAGYKDFFVIGVNPNSDVANFYVSKFTSIKEEDFQSTNFGAPYGTEVGVPSASDGPAETVYVLLNKSNNITVPAAAADGSVSFYVYYKLKTDGSYDWAVLDMTDDQMKDFGNLSDKKFDAADIDSYTVLKKGNIPNVYPAAEEGKESTYYLDSKDDEGNKITKQNKIGYYAQIAAGKTLEGEWYVPGTTFHEAEDAE